MIRKTMIFFAALAVCAVAVAQPVRVGYSNGTVNRSQLARFGSAAQQGQMIRLSAEKVKELKGAQLTGLALAVGTKNATQYEMFLRTSPEGENLAQVTGGKPSSANKIFDYSFDTPYTVTGDEPALYLGYTCNAGSYSVLSYDFSGDSREVSFALNGGAWFDTYGQGLGMPNLYLLADGKPVATDLMLKTYTQQGYYKTGGVYAHSVELLNCGQTTVTAFDALVDMGDGTLSRQPIGGLNLAPQAVCKVDLPELSSQKVGYQPVGVSIENIVTAEGAAVDADPSDNALTASIFFYPADVRKNILLEGFTSQYCNNCPAGHRTIAAAVEQLEEEGITVHEVVHHSGYQNDIFTMREDNDCCFFYGSNSTFAPAVMVNRWRASTSSNPGPVFNTSATVIVNTVHSCLEREPYVQLHLATQYDADTRRVAVRLGVECLRKPEGETLLNLLLTQDNLTAYQVLGGTEYAHNAVSRGSLLDNVWGTQVQLEEGKTWFRELTYELPESITSSLGAPNAQYGETIDIPVVPQDMRLTAYVAAYDSEDCNGNEVYNCVQVPLVAGGDYDAVERVTVAETAAPAVRYNLQGQQVGKGYRGIVVVNGRKVLVKD